MLEGNDLFRNIFNREPELAARAPGRINLIGEHIDYNNCPVLPAAVNREITALAAFREDKKIIISSTQPGSKNREFFLEKEIPPFPIGDWGNYPKAAFLCMMDYTQRAGLSVKELPGLEILYHSTIPGAAGLSSSSALVVITALLFLTAYNVPEPEKLDLAALLAEGEKYVGTQGGGMDQAAILFGKTNHAVKIRFNPLTISYVPFPEEYDVIVADSLVKAPKTREALDKYNLRSMECRIAATMLNRRLSEEHDCKNPVIFLGDLTEEKTGIPKDILNKDIWRFFHTAPYTLNEISIFFGETPEATARRFCKRKDGSILPEPEEGFKLMQRFSHVMSEWNRVEDSAKALSQKDMTFFGELMNQSHTSCRDLYEISCRELDELTKISTEAGALGSRLTGAGFGGCTVSVVPREKTGKILHQIEKKYYLEYLGTKQDISESLFATTLTQGAECRRNR